MSVDQTDGLIIKKDNRLIEARYKLTLNEQRLILGLASMVRQDDEDFKDYIINVDDLSGMFGVTKSNSFYEKMQEAVNILMDTRGAFNISTDDDEVEKVHWVSYAKYKKGSGKILMRFDKSIKEFLLQLNAHFTQYQLSAVRQFRSIYAIRFYELLAMKRNHGKNAKEGWFFREFGIDELKTILVIGQDEYPLFGNLKQKVINPALSEINEYSDLEIIKHGKEWAEYVKQGRSVHKIIIRAKPKVQKQMDLLDKAEAEELSENTSKAQDNLLKAGVSFETAKKWLSKFGSKRIERNLAYALAKKEAGQVKTNLIGYLAKAIDEDWANGWEEQQTKVKETKKKEESAERKKEREEAEKVEKERQEKERIFNIFTEQSESMQDIILDMVEQKYAYNQSLLAFLRKDRANENFLNFQTKSFSKFKEVMQENGLVD